MKVTRPTSTCTNVLGFADRFSAARAMITALRKKFAAPPSPSNGQKPAKTKQGIGLVNADLQKKFANGVNFNSECFSGWIVILCSVKVVIRGDRNVGKTCLWRRLQGQPFSADYTPTDEIQASHQNLIMLICADFRSPTSPGTTERATSSSKWTCGTWWTRVGGVGPNRTA